MTVLSGSTSQYWSWMTLSLVVKNAENNVYGNKAATNRANMIPPFRIPKVVCRQITSELGQKKRPAPNPPRGGGVLPCMGYIGT